MTLGYNYKNKELNLSHKKMPVLAERKKMTKEELEGLIPYILEVRRREKNKELQLLQQITCHDEDLQKEKEEEDERHIKRLQDIKVIYFEMMYKI